MQFQKGGSNGSTTSSKNPRSQIHDNYRDFQESAIRDAELGRQLVAKALDVPYSPLRDVIVNKNSNVLAAIVGAGLLGVGIWLASQWLNDPPATPPTPPAPAAPATPVHTTDVWDYEIDMDVEEPE